MEVSATGKTKLSYRLQKISAGLTQAEKNRRRDLLLSRLAAIRRQLAASLFIGHYVEDLPDVSGDLYVEPFLTGYHYRVIITPQQDGSSLHQFNIFLDEAELLPAGSGSFTVQPGDLPVLDGSLTITAGRAAPLSGAVSTSTPGPDQHRTEVSGTMGDDETFSTVILGDPLPLDWRSGSLAWGPNGSDHQATLTDLPGEGNLVVTGTVSGGAETYSFLVQAGGDKDMEPVTVLGQLKVTATGALLAELTTDIDGNGMIVYSDGSSEAVSAP